ncbi:MAG: NAD-binding protein [Desulfocapsaceae bacterium]|nr:NAD-binding protein [Desulfocapsaceae bacterium]
MDSRRRIWVALAVTLFFLGVGTVGYVKIEHFPPLDAFYMTVITISTVGFGEVHPLSEAGRVFTIFLILFGVGSLAFAAHAFTESMIERASNPNLRKKAMEKKIQKLDGHYIICGHGRVGAASADRFHSIGVDFVVIDRSEEHLRILAEQGYNYLAGDATREETLIEAGIKRAGALLALLDSDPDNLCAVLTARELNPTLHIVARTEVASSESRILRAGADSVISPYASAGRRVADRILMKTMEDKIRDSRESVIGNVPHWIMVNEKSGLASHALETANQILSGTIVGMRREGRDILMPTLDVRLQMGDELLVCGEHPVVMTEARTQQPKKIVLIDDNPVIRRLYTRLFQKAGFNIITAVNGREGYELILEEKPDAAVVDLMLPDISGFDVCRQIREQDIGKDIKLFLFTADNHDETRKKALESGADTVVVKSPDAQEIIGIVKSHLQSGRPIL